MKDSEFVTVKLPRNRLNLSWMSLVTDCEDCRALRAALTEALPLLTMADYELQCSAEELNRPQTEWRWDELRRVELALLHVRDAAKVLAALAAREPKGEPC